jgi:hypothetical protein
MTPLFLTSALYGGEWSASRPRLFACCIGGSSELVWTLWSRKTSLASAGNRTRAVQPVAHRNTDYAIPVPHTV